MITDSADPLQVMRRMGHSDIRTTYNLYGHLFPDREDELVAKLNSRHSRALEALGRPELGPGEENNFESILSRQDQAGLGRQPQLEERSFHQEKRTWAQVDLNHRPHPYQG